VSMTWTILSKPEDSTIPSMGEKGTYRQDKAVMFNYSAKLTALLGGTITIVTCDAGA
jgi:hypothetical protein